MGSKKRPKEVPALPLGKGKQPRQGPLKVLERTPHWCFRYADRDGRWPWSGMTADQAKRTLDRLRELSNNPWGDIEGGEHHFAEVKALVQDAQTRLARLFPREEDLPDTLFSIRVTGAQRIWGRRMDHVLEVLWWDPDHSVYPCPKKHT